MKRACSWGVRLISGTISSAWACGSLLQQRCTHMQVDLGLAAAGGAEQQKRLPSVRSWASTSCCSR
jgi:hypothetical protein